MSFSVMDSSMIVYQEKKKPNKMYILEAFKVKFYNLSGPGQPFKFFVMIHPVLMLCSSNYMLSRNHVSRPQWACLALH